MLVSKSTLSGGCGETDKGGLSLFTVVVSLGVTEWATNDHDGLGWWWQGAVDFPIGAAHLFVELQPKVSANFWLLAPLDILDLFADVLAADKLSQTAKMGFTDQLDVLVVPLGLITVGTTADEDEVQLAEVSVLISKCLRHFLKVECVSNLFLLQWTIDVDTKLENSVYSI